MGMAETGEALALKDDDLLDRLRRWGGPAEMSAFEAVMWLAEVDPRLKSTTISVLMLDRAPDWDRFQAEHRWLVAAVPRFRQKVVVPAFGLGQPVWVEDPAFDLDYHLRRTHLPEPGSERQLLDMAAILAMSPFDRTRPPWESVLIEGLDGGRAAWVLKLHHATSDGLGIIQLLSRVFRHEREAAPRPLPAAGSDRRRAARTAGSLGLESLRKRLAALPGVTGGAAAALGQSLAALARNPESASTQAQATLGYLASARKMLGIKPASGSGLFKRRSLSWRLDAIEVPLAGLKAAARAVDASVNDSFLSALIGGFRRYHEEMGVAIRQMPIGFPISLRTADDTMGGNKFAGSQYAAPVAEKDPVARIRDIQRFVRETRAEPALDVMIRLMPVVTRLPIATVTRLTLDFTRAQDAQISNIPGIGQPVFFAGAEVTHFWPFAPVPGCGMMIAMISHNGRCCIGINSDRAAVTEPELLMQCFREGLDEVLALGRAAAAKPPKSGKSATRTIKRKKA